MIKLSKSCIGEAEKEAVVAVLDVEFLGMGGKVQEFETKLGAFFGRSVSCVSTGTAALHLALQSLGVGVGDEVLVPSITYVASFQAISATGATPVACDVCSKTLTLDVEDVAKKINERTKVIMPVHYAGGMGDLNAIYALAKNHNLRVVEDAAHAFGSRYEDSLVGSFGDVICFSFDGIKNITSGEGGCVVSDDQKVLDHVNDARLLAVIKDSDNRFAGKRSWDFDVVTQGWRYHMSDIMAAIGIVQLNRLPDFAKRRQLLASYYDGLLCQNPDLKSLPQDYNQVVPHIYPVILPIGTDRHELMRRMLESNIQVGIHYQPNHKLSLYKSQNSDDLGVVDVLSTRLLSLPLHPDLVLADLEVVVDTLNKNLSEMAEQNE